MNYKNKKWEMLRLRILKRDKYICQECRRYGRKEKGLPVEAKMVHHIFPSSQTEEYKYLPANLISLCNKCHGAMHDRVTNELTPKGQELLERKRKEIEEAWQKVSL